MLSGKVAEWSKALVLGSPPPYTSLKGRGFESHPCQFTFLACLFVFLAVAAFTMEYYSNSICEKFQATT